MKKEDLLLIGGGGHCKACIDVIEQQNLYRIVGIIDVTEKVGSEVLGYEVLASDDELPQFVKTIRNVHISMGFIKNGAIRARLYEKAKMLGFEFPLIISPQSYISKHAQVEEGSIVMHRAIINANAHVGKNTIINTACLIEHDTQIGNHSHISTGAIINGNCIIGNQVFIGSGTVAIQGTTVCDHCTIGANSLIIKNLHTAGTYIGNPVKNLML